MSRPCRLCVYRSLINHCISISPIITLLIFLSLSQLSWQDMHTCLLFRYGTTAGTILIAPGNFRYPLGIYRSIPWSPSSSARPVLAFLVVFLLPPSNPFSTFVSSSSLSPHNTTYKPFSFLGHFPIRRRRSAQDVSDLLRLAAAVVVVVFVVVVCYCLHGFC